MKAFIYLFIYLFLVSCNSNKLVIRDGIEGYIFDKQTNKPINNASLGFYINPSDSTNLNIKNEYFSDKKGLFNIPPVLKNVKSYQGKIIYANRYKKFLKIKKENYIIRKIDIRDTIYRKDKKKHFVYVDTIFLKPLK